MGIVLEKNRSRSDPDGSVGRPTDSSKMEAATQQDRRTSGIIGAGREATGSAQRGDR